MIPRTKKLFISYRSSDAPKVDKIARDLRLLKYDDGTPRYTTWQDKHNLPPASPNWWDAIVDAIIACDMFVFHLSRESLQSDVCRAELEYAYKRNRPIIPVVLDGEFNLITQSGKYDLPKETWTLTPDWLADIQLLFYIETKFYNSFQEAVALFERNWPPDTFAQRPLNPNDKAVHGSNHALYDAACDYAERLAFTDAEKQFSTLVKRNDTDYADASAQWLELIRRYVELVEINERRGSRFLFKSRWDAYQALFPKYFIEGIFDPRGLGQLNNGSSEQQVITSVKPTSQFLMPAPFDWIEIPGGRGTMKTNDSSITLEIPNQAYQIAKYPITNAQFAKFIEAGGYNQQKWWTEGGWAQREKDSWIQPRLWTDNTWNGAEQPVVGLSWYEAIAFCLWLSEMTDEKIMLPTEDQWQYAAQGDDDRAYPWGNDWNCKRCNNSVNPCNSNVTTPVRQYEGKTKGDSPFGIVNMAGNVWEWCLTDYANRTNHINSNAKARVLRGGSWTGYNSSRFHCDYRLRYNPHLRLNYVGFRISRF